MRPSAAPRAEFSPAHSGLAGGFVRITRSWTAVVPLAQGCYDAGMNRLPKEDQLPRRGPFADPRRGAVLYENALTPLLPPLLAPSAKAISYREQINCGAVELLSIG